MRRNRRVKKRSRFATSSMGVASLIVSGLIMMMIYFAMNSKCSAIAREIGQKEKELRSLEQELMREQTRWDEMKVPARLNMALTRFGLEMAVPREDQLVRMSKAGVPVPGQFALARLRGTTGQSAVATREKVQAAPVKVQAAPVRIQMARAKVQRPSISPSTRRRPAKNGVRK